LRRGLLWRSFWWYGASEKRASNNL